MTDSFTKAHKHRLAWMPWLWDTLKLGQRNCAIPWQTEIQPRFSSLEEISFGEEVFVAPCAHLFAEPSRDIMVGDACKIAAEVFLHAPLLWAPTPA